MSTTKRQGKAPIARKSPAPRAARGRAEVAVGRRNLPVINTPGIRAPRAQVPCLTCGLCCSYVAVEIDGPSTLDAATNILWYWNTYTVAEITFESLILKALSLKSSQYS